MPNRSKILLVEDDSFTRYMMKEIIATLEVPVDVAVDGQDGYAQIVKNPKDYGLVLMDIHMPKLSGVDATQQIRSLEHDPPSNVPIYAVTADETYHDMAKISALGMDGFISKPITAGELRGLVYQYCAR